MSMKTMFHLAYLHAVTLLFGGAVAGFLSERAFSFSLPQSKGSATYSSPKIVSGTFDGGMKTYGLGKACTGQQEGGDSDAVFLVENGGTLKNAIVGKDQIEGVHCLGSCTLENVWWADVCEDALTLKGNGNAYISGGGAQHAKDKVIQHNGFGTVTIDGFQVQDFGKLYRSCGNCKNNGGKRTVVMKNVKAKSGKSLVGINNNYGDTASFSNTCAETVKELCVTYTGNNNGGEPPKSGTCSSSGITTSC